MWINAQLNKISKEDTIVLANNRQVLAFKKTWHLQKGNCALPKSLSWQQYLIQTWRTFAPNSSKRLISNIESRTLIAKSMRKLRQKTDNRLLNEVIKNNDYCHAHLIQYSQLSTSQNCDLFTAWLQDYQQTKLTHNLLDINDLPALIIAQHSTLPKPYLYGFKTLTPQQSLLFDTIGHQVLETQQKNTQSNNKIFQTTDDEILSAAQWAQAHHTRHPHHHIAIVCPTLSSQHHQIKSIFNQVFSDTLTETGQKAYNISLGLPLTDAPLIRHLLALLELCQQLPNNRISTKLFNTVITSPYLHHAQAERSKRALLVNRVLSFSQTHFKLTRLSPYLDTAPHLQALLSDITLSAPKQQTHDQWLIHFNTLMQNCGFATDRTLSSTEYQLFNKTQNASLGLNQLAQTHHKVSATHALLDLENTLSQVIFQAQSAPTPIQILGSLEAEGLIFERAWVLGMSDDFLPMALNSPTFIPHAIAQHHQIPHTSFTLITKDAQNTLNNLINLSSEVICSYAKSHFNTEQRPSPLCQFTHELPALTRHHQAPAQHSLPDQHARPLPDPHIHNGVNTLKDQMSCPFKGFAHRLNIQSFDPPHIGLDRRQQGKIIHTALQYFYQQITTQAALLALKPTELDTLIQRKITQALAHYTVSAFRQNEQKRLLTILHQFIRIDQQRDPFTVLATEQQITTNIAGLTFTTRLDRLDETHNADKIIFDYKISNPTTSHWNAPVIKEPQLPIYAISNPVQGIAFIQLNADKVAIKGLFKAKDPQQWQQQTNAWKTTLETTSKHFQHAHAAVLPNNTACQYCPLTPLCRVKG
ncbi:FIG01199495: hypothetical protein [uncultured Candidatus Thioglobus sp.]|nr:FIG01199495: hypothetical protein [uncultured Candidatus Thioglobus sp.]